ncbi:hypothetical protein BU17DRAFT_99697 [Hysterangium stoloniferum]|nr:hypothetical protein BU17DRAFT_99697 [Hysterangium stoloniferum]
MSLPAPKPLSVSTNPGLAPAAARAAAQDAQISELVQQNRNLEQSIVQLRSQLKAEEARAIEAVNSIHDQWKAESKEWRDGCDALQARHRLGHLATRVALEHERGFRLEDKEQLLQERVATLQREYKITLFQAKETDLMLQVVELEDEVESQREELVQILSEHEIEVARLNAKLGTAEARRHANTEQAGNVAKEIKTLEKELLTLHSASTSNLKQIDRLKLQIESLHTQNAMLETRNRELQHQVDKWQSLENKGEKEVEDLRKRRIELEVRVKELEVTLKESRGVDKKITKLEASLLETQEQFEQSQQDIAEARADMEQAQKLVAKFERQVDRLKAALEAEKAKSAQSLKKEKETLQNAAKIRKQVHVAVEEYLEDGEIDEDETTSKPPSRIRKTQSIRSEGSHSKHKGKEKELVEEVRDGRLKGLHPKNLDKQPVNFGGISEELEEGQSSDILVSEELDKDHLDVTSIGEMGSAQHGIGDGEAPQGSKQDLYRDKILLGNQGHGEKASLGEPKESSTRPPRKAKARETESDTEGRPPRKRARSKPPSVIESQQVLETDLETVKKKKRKLNVSGGTSIFNNQAGFTWNQDGEDLGIPSVLSPIKDGQPVPPRVTSAGTLGKFTFKMW